MFLIGAIGLFNVRLIRWRIIGGMRGGANPIIRAAIVLMCWILIGVGAWGVCPPFLLLSFPGKPLEPRHLALDSCFMVGYGREVYQRATSLGKKNLVLNI